MVLLSLCSCIYAAGGEEKIDGSIPAGNHSPSAGMAPVGGYGASSDPVEVVVITSPGCTKCAAAERTLERIGQKVALNVTAHYYYTDEGHRIIDQYRARDIPAIIIGSEVIDYRDYGGESSLLESKVLQSLANQSLNSGPSPAIALPDRASPIQGRDDATAGYDYDLQELSLSTALAVTAGGFVAGFNPVSLAFSSFWRHPSSPSPERGELMMMVLFFSLAYSPCTFSSGLGMQRLLHSEAIAASFRYVLTVLLIGAGLSQVVDAALLRQGRPSLFRTDWALQYFQAGVDRGRSSSYFLAGALFSLVKAPCVGGLYLAILDLISSKSYLVGAAYLMFFNLGVVLPIIVVGGFLALGMSPDRVDSFRKDHRVGMRLFTGLMLLALAPLIYWQII
ncbi:MAG: sulfite exporter TauE/SafE family protein [Methanothrix sp.]|uniref:cytochrome c biogenesis protein n=1 Tax=Methanothrix sp. TaxID=90426 RepID=UPI0025E4587D|nr:cytochrome c biogenesis protein CcdA [Methanothrix sp.]MBK7385996.1 sulfite exporter TauE/SafE family protein [Methanothrix sp.]